MNEWILLRADSRAWIVVSRHISELKAINKLIKIIDRPDYDGAHYMIVRLAMLYAPERKP
jgi:hypothetical protein